MGEQPPFAGLGKLYFCRVGDKDKEPQPLGEPGRIGRTATMAVIASTPTALCVTARE